MGEYASLKDKENCPEAPKRRQRGSYYVEKHEDETTKEVTSEDNHKIAAATEQDTTEDTSRVDDTITAKITSTTAVVKSTFSRFDKIIFAVFVCTWCLAYLLPQICFVIE